MIANDASTLDWQVVGMVLVAALLHAGWNTIVKRDDDGLVAMALVKIPNLLVSATVLAFVGLPRAECWPYLLGSTVANGLYFYFLINAYRVGDLSVAYPVSRSIAPVLVMGISAFAAGEVPTVAGVAGTALISLAILAIGVQGGASKQHYQTLAWAAAVGISISIYTVLDGLGARAGGNPIGYVALLNIFTGVMVSAVAIRARGAKLAVALRTRWPLGLAGGTMMLATYTIIVYALTIAPMALVAALRESSVIFAALIGAVLLREPFGGRRMLASVVVAAGIVTLAIGR